MMGFLENVPAGCELVAMGLPPNEMGLTTVDGNGGAAGANVTGFLKPNEGVAGLIGMIFARAAAADDMGELDELAGLPNAPPTAPFTNAMFLTMGY